MTTMTHEVRVQAGSQVDFTTGITPTVLLRGIEEMPIRSENQIEVLNDMTLGLAGGSTSAVMSIAAAGSVRGWATYEDLPYFLDNLLGEATPSGSDPYTRAYAAPSTTAPTPRILSLVKGDATVGAYQMVGALLSNLTLTMEPDDMLRFNGDLVGNSLASDALESLSDRTVYPILSSEISGITWDAWGGTMGTTAMTLCTVRSMELALTPDRATRPCFGSLTNDNYVERMWDGTLRMSLEFNATTKTDVDAIIGGTLTQKQVEITFTRDANHSLVLQFAGTVTEDLEIFEDDDGVVAVEVTMQRTYHSTFGNWFAASSVNQVATLA